MELPVHPVFEYEKSKGSDEHSVRQKNCINKDHRNYIAVNQNEKRNVEKYGTCYQK